MKTTLSIRDVLSMERVCLLKSGGKEAALRELVDRLATSPRIQDPEELAREMFERESLMSTGIGLGIGVPHVRLASVEDVVMSVGIRREGIEGYASLDEQPVRIVCMIAAHRDQHAEYLRTLAAVSGMLKNEAVRKRILAAQDAAEVYAVLISR